MLIYINSNLIHLYITGWKNMKKSIILTIAGLVEFFLPEMN